MQIRTPWACNALVSRAASLESCASTITRIRRDRKLRGRVYAPRRLPAHHHALLRRAHSRSSAITRSSLHERRELRRLDRPFRSSHVDRLFLTICATRTWPARRRCPKMHAAHRDERSRRAGHLPQAEHATVPSGTARRERVGYLAVRRSRVLPTSRPRTRVRRDGIDARNQLLVHVVHRSDLVQRWHASALVACHAVSNTVQSEGKVSGGG